MSPQKILVIGGDSAIGAGLGNYLRHIGMDVVMTSRRASWAGSLDLDLSRRPPADLPHAFGAAILCAGVTSLAACERDEPGSRFVNVDQSLALGLRLAETGTLVIGLSSNLVFDGAVPQRDAHDLPCPTTAYGRQKQDLERGVLALGDRGAIVRLTKVLSPTTMLLRGWVESLHGGRPIEPFSDMVMAPISLARVVSALSRVITDRRSGLFQLSAENDMSYAEAAIIICRHLAKDRDLIRPRKAASAGIATGSCPRHTSLSTDRAQADLGWRPVDAQTALAEILLE